MYTSFVGDGFVDHVVFARLLVRLRGDQVLHAAVGFALCRDQARNLRRTQTWQSEQILDSRRR